MVQRCYPQFISKTVRRHKICVLLRCFDSKYARYMSFKSALYPAQILCLLTLRAQTERISSFSRQTKETGSTPIEDNAENEEIIILRRAVPCKLRVRKTLCDTTLLSKEKNELSQKLVEQVEQIQELIEVNSRVAQNQEEYQKQYEKLVNEYEITKVEHQKLELDISNKLAKSETLSVFINTIKKQETLLETFDEMMWGSLLESVVVYKDNVLFKFRDGTEIKG